MEPNTQQTPEETIFQEEDFSMEGYDKHIRNARESQKMLKALGKK
jgi:hypothetical protein